MDIKYRLYPHPVLWSKNDDYNNSYFDCEIELTHEFRTTVLNAEFKLDNEEIAELIRMGKAEYILHIESTSSSYRVVKTSMLPNKIIKIQDEHLLGRVSLCPFIVAKEDIHDFTNKDFNIDYTGVSFKLVKGTIIAIGTQQTFKVDKENEDLSKIPSIFTVFKYETIDEIPIVVEINSEKIRIGLNITDYENYYAAVHDKADVVNAFIIYPALIYTFERLKEGFDDFSDYRWFKALEKIFVNQGMVFSEDYFSSKTSIELSQKVMNLPISSALFTMVHADDNNGDEE